MAKTIYYTIILIAFSVASYYKQVFIIPTCITLTALILHEVRKILFNKVKVEKMSNAITELKKQIDAIRVFHSQSTRRK